MKRVALITGGARGIGFGIAQCLAKEGCDLALCGVRPEAAVGETVETLRNLGAEVFYVQADVGDADARHRLIEAVRKQYGRLDVLVNNAGISSKTRADLLEAGPESFHAVLRTNLEGPFFLTQTCARWMIKQKGRSATGFYCIVNVSSISATMATINRGDYCISKAGISMATQLWAARLGEFDIPVYEVRPGIIRSDMTAGVQAKYDKLFSEGLAIQSRWGMPEDVGRAVAALVRGDLSYSTGQVIMVDGGMTVPRL
jgi:3-oxoacyl-[acyl-carrier protein] reductase